MSAPPPHRSLRRRGGSTRLRGRSALKLHAVLTTGLLICVGAFAIEWVRALDGNQLSWVYVIEWPILASFAIYLWWHLLHEPDRTGREETDDAGPRAATERAEEQERPDEELEAWRQYLRALRADDVRSAGDAGSKGDAKPERDARRS